MCSPQKFKICCGTCVNLLGCPGAQFWEPFGYKKRNTILFFHTLEEMCTLCFSFILIYAILLCSYLEPKMRCILILLFLESDLSNQIWTLYTGIKFITEKIAIFFPRDILTHWACVTDIKYRVCLNNKGLCESHSIPLPLFCKTICEWIESLLGKYFEKKLSSRDSDV